MQKGRRHPSGQFFPWAEEPPQQIVAIDDYRKRSMKVATRIIKRPAGRLQAESLQRRSILKMAEN
jgi:hypothetical protein